MSDSGRLILHGCPLVANKSKRSTSLLTHSAMLGSCKQHNTKQVACNISSQVHKVHPGLHRDKTKANQCRKTQERQRDAKMHRVHHSENNLCRHTWAASALGCITAASKALRERRHCKKKRAMCSKVWPGIMREWHAMSKNVEQDVECSHTLTQNQGKPAGNITAKLCLCLSHGSLAIFSLQLREGAG